METLKINKKINSLEEELFGEAIEKVLREIGTLRFNYKETGSLGDIQKGMFGLDKYIFEVEGQGVIVYEKVNKPGFYISNIHFLGFGGDKEDEGTYKQLKSKLEGIANGGAEELKKGKL